jgi:PHS family inorganic phosphate transporter-like MFS transporter
MPGTPELLPNSPDEKHLNISVQRLSSPFNHHSSQGDHLHTNGSSAPHHEGKESWSEFWHGFREYLFGTEKWTLRRFWRSVMSKDEHDGSWTDLAGTASTWFCLDFSFYFLTVNSPKLISKIWDSPNFTGLYPMLQDYSTRAIISTSIGALLGGAMFIVMAKRRWQIQLFGFLALAVLFVVVGVCFITLLGGRYFAVVIILYIACNLVFDFGPNTATFVV